MADITITISGNEYDDGVKLRSCLNGFELYNDLNDIVERIRFRLRKVEISEEEERFLASLVEETPSIHLVEVLW